MNEAVLIRRAGRDDLSRIAEIFVFNNRINYLPIFRDESYSFGEMQVVSLIDRYFGKPEILDLLYVAERNGLILGFAEIGGDGGGTECGKELIKLYADPFFQGRGVGAALLAFAKESCGVRFLWALEKNIRARKFYQRHGFFETGERRPEDGTEEFLLRLALKPCKTE